LTLRGGLKSSLEIEKIVIERRGTPISSYWGGIEQIRLSENIQDFLFDQA